MIDLQKPLEGVPGLLLMAALIFFGATIGIAVAIGFTWIPMSDALANFLGGVVGAGLGAALAVMGAVYVQRREQRQRLEGPINAMLMKVEMLSDLLKQLAKASVGSPLKMGQAQWDLMQVNVRLIEEDVLSLSDGAELSSDIHAAVLKLKALVPFLVDTLKRHFEGHLGPPPEQLVKAIEGSAAQLDALAQRVRSL